MPFRMVIHMGCVGMPISIANCILDLSGRMHGKSH